MGTCSMLWTAAWFFLAYDSPASHPNITEEVPFHPNFLTSPQNLPNTNKYLCSEPAASDQTNTSITLKVISQELAELDAVPVGSKAPPLPWREVVTSAPIWGIIFTDASNTFGLCPC